MSAVRYRIKGTSQYVPPVASADLSGLGEGPAVPAGPYDAANGTGRRSRAWRVGSYGPNAAIVYALEDLRRKSRDLARKSPYAAAAVDRLTSNLIGTGIVPKSTAPNAAYKKQVMDLWLRWTDEADSTGALDFYGLQALAVRGMIEGGETFTRLRVRRLSDGLSVPLQLQLIEGDQCPHTKTDPQKFIRQGIQYNAIGQRTGYYILKEHPGDAPFGGFADSLNPVLVPAAEIAHLYRPLRPGQDRGEPWLARALKTIYELEAYLDAELVRKKTAAMFVAFVKRSIGNDDPTGSGAADAEGTASLSLEPGTMQFLLDGEDMVFSEPKDVGDPTTLMLGPVVELQETYVAASAVPSDENNVAIEMVRDDPRVWDVLAEPIVVPPGPVSDAPTDVMRPTIPMVTARCERIETGIELVWGIGTAVGAKSYSAELSFDDGVTWELLQDQVANQAGRLPIQQSDDPVTFRARAFGTAGLPGDWVQTTFLTIAPVIDGAQIDVINLTIAALDEQLRSDIEGATKASAEALAHAQHLLEADERYQEFVAALEASRGTQQARLTFSSNTQSERIDESNRAVIEVSRALIAATERSEARFQEVVTLIADLDEATAQRLTALSATVDANFARYTAFEQTTTTQTSALSQSITQHEARIGANESSIVNEAAARVAGDQSSVTIATQAKASADQISAFGQLSFAAVAAPSGAYAAWTLSATAGNISAGFTVLANSNGTAAIQIDGGQVISKARVTGTSQPVTVFDLNSGSLTIWGAT